MSLSAALQEARVELHRPLELRLSRNFVNGLEKTNSVAKSGEMVAATNHRTFQEAFNRVLGSASNSAGVPFAVCESTPTVPDGPEMSLAYRDEPSVFDVKHGDQSGPHTLAALMLRTKLRPDLFFGPEQAIQWMSIAAGPFYRSDLEAALEALGEPEGHTAMTAILSRLVEERVALTDGKRITDSKKPLQADTAVKAILTTTARVAKGSDETSISETVEQIRVALKDISANYYVNHYHVEDVFEASEELMDAAADPARVAEVNDSVLYYALNREATFVVVVSRPAVRRSLRDIIEALFREGRLSRPAVVLSTDELPSGRVLPRAPKTMALRK